MVTSEQLTKTILDDKGLPGSFEVDIFNQIDKQLQDIKNFNLTSVNL